MTVIRVKPKKTPCQVQESKREYLPTSDTERSDQHLNLKELNGIEFDQDHKPCTWTNRKRKLFAGTPDF